MPIKLFISFIHFTNFSYILLDCILHYIPPKICILLFHNQCLEFYLKQIMLLFEFIVLSKDIIIVKGFDSLSLLQNLLQSFIKSHIYLCMFMSIFAHLCSNCLCISFFLWAPLAPFVASREFAPYSYSLSKVYYVPHLKNPSLI